MRYFAFLRAINVGGHTVKMDALRQLFESLGYANIETFIASGNVIFDSASANTSAREKEIEARLRQALGYDVATFIRSGEELAAIATYRPFPLDELDAARAFNVAFRSSAMDEAVIQLLMNRRTDIDNFHVHGREVYWLCLKKQSESTFSNAVLEKVTGRQSTLRGVNTILKLCEKYALSGE